MDTLCVKSLKSLEENIEELKESYKLYNLFKKKVEVEEENIRKFTIKKNSEYLVAILNNFIDECGRKGISLSENKNAQIFLKENTELVNFCDAEDRKLEWLRQMDAISHFFHNEYAELVLLNKDGKRYILELKNQEMLDLNKYDKDLANFIVTSLTNMNEMFEIEQQDLPLLMAIKHDMPYNPNLKHIEKSCRWYEEYLILTEIPNRIYLEFKRAKMVEQNITDLDEIKANIPFIREENNQDKMWNELENTELSEKDFWVEYYKKLMLFGENVEELYLSAPEDRKGYVIDAYHYYSSAYSDEHFRVTSPLINEEVLKRKYVKKKKIKSN